MKIIINGKEEAVAENATLEEIVASRGLNPGGIIVELNYALVKRESWPDTILRENDRVEILRFVGGG
ncbi:MAG: sulfur carrier protein ThiS [Peptococcaceae bacterium]|nr:sulfur carrier protein ThiS [Peptococcaceae bacterium]